MSGQRRTATRGHENLRLRIAQAAARIMAEEGVHDYHTAKRKAVLRLNLPEARNLPSNAEIEQALAAHLALFQAQQLPQKREQLRGLALQLMQLFERFDPRLVGALLSGQITRFSGIQLHLTAEPVDLLAFFLQEQGIPYTQGSKRLRFGGDRYENIPTYSFLAEDIPVEVSVFSPTAAREAPLSPVDGRPMKRAGLKEIEAGLRS